MSNLKSAYELSLERFIKSSYVKKNVESDDDDFSIDFISDVNVNYDEDVSKNDYDSAFIENDGEEAIVKKEIDEKITSGIDDGYKAKPLDKQTLYFNRGVKNARIIGDFFSYSGISRFSRALLFEINAKGVLSSSVNIGNRIDVNNSTKDEINFLSNIDLHNPINIYILENYEVVDDSMLKLSKGGYKILYSCFNKLNMDILKKFDEFWTSSMRDYNFLLDNGFKNVHFIGVGCDTLRYSYEKVYKFNKINLKKYSFLNFVNDREKMVEIIPYLNEFNSGDDISMLIISKNPDLIEDCFFEIADSMGVNEEDLPHVELYEDCISETHMPKLYNFCDCLYNLGFDQFPFSIVEAVSSDMTVISSSFFEEFQSSNIHYLSRLEENTEDILRRLYNQGRKISLVKNDHSWSKLFNNMYNIIKNKEI